jgi:hypothetical protein
MKGSRDHAHLDELVAAFPEEDDFDDEFEEDEDRPPAFAVALGAIINGEPIEDSYWPTYADASHAIYQQFGVMLDANAISPSNPPHLHAVSAFLDAVDIGDKVPIFNFSRTPPLLPAAPEPFPILSHMTPREVADARGLLERIDFSAQIREVQESLRMIADWIQEASAHCEGLVCVYG